MPSSLLYLGVHVPGGVLFGQVALTLTNLAALLVKMEKFPQAEDFYRRALTIREESLGPDHFLVHYSSSTIDAFSRGRDLLWMYIAFFGPPLVACGKQVSGI